MTPVTRAKIPMREREKVREIAKKNCDVIFTTSRNFTHIVAIFISINIKPVNEANV